MATLNEGNSFSKRKSTDAAGHSSASSPGKRCDMSRPGTLVFAAMSAE